MTTLDFAGEEIHDARLFVGTSVVSGTGSALVTATGARTSDGETAKHTRSSGRR